MKKNSRDFVSLKECGIDETSRFCIDTQIKVFREQVILAEKSHLPLVLHSPGIHTFEQMYDVLSTMLNTKHRVQWHYANANSDLSTLETSGTRDQFCPVSSWDEQKCGGTRRSTGQKIVGCRIGETQCSCTYYH